MPRAGDRSVRYGQVGDGDAELRGRKLQQDVARLGAGEAEVRRVVGARHAVVHEGACDELTGLVVDRFFIKRLADVPRNSHLRFDYVASIEAIKEVMGPDALENFSNWNYYTYVLLKPGVTAAVMEEKLEAYNRERFADGGYAMSALFVEVIKSPAFRMRRAQEVTP